MPLTRTASLPCEYAKYKNRSGFLRRPHNVLIECSESSKDSVMADDPKADETNPPRKELTPAAQRALAEAEARRKAAAEAMPRPKEFQGPKGPEPTRYGDWENKGIASDF